MTYSPLRLCRCRQEDKREPLGLKVGNVIYDIHRGLGLDFRESMKALV
jgi:hypothetical protein